MTVTLFAIWKIGVQALNEVNYGLVITAQANAYHLRNAESSANNRLLGRLQI